MFEVTIMAGVTLAVGIDDVTISSGTCPDPGSCTFEDVGVGGTMCMWSQSFVDEGDYILRSSYWMLVDHTYGKDCKFT